MRAPDRCVDCKKPLTDKQERHGDRHCARCQRRLARTYAPADPQEAE